MDICKREANKRYSCYVFDYENKIVWKKAFDRDDNLCWQVINYNDQLSNVIRIDINSSDQNYELIDTLYNEIINSKKDNKESFYFDDISEYDNFCLYNSKENFIHWSSDTGRINTEELYILQKESSYSIVFLTPFSNVKNINIVFGTNNSKYGNFSEAFRRDFYRTMDIAYDKFDESLDKIKQGSKQYAKKGGN